MTRTLGREAARGFRVGPYVIEVLLGQGGMAQVFRARHAASGSLVALKFLKSATAELLPTIRREIASLSGLRHPGVVRIRDTGSAGGIPWFAMDLIAGRPLGATIAGLWASRAAPPHASHGPVTSATSTVLAAVPARPVAHGAPPPVVGDVGQPHASMPRAFLPRCFLELLLPIFHRLCLTLRYIHGEGIVHRDLKPDNILVDTSGRPILVDFGLSASFAGGVGRELTVDGVFSGGTLAYMSPEQIAGELVDARADLYALGCMLYEALAGAPPFASSEPMAILHGHLAEAPAPLGSRVDGVPAALEQLVARLLAKAPGERIGYADDAAAVLRELGAEALWPADSPAPRPYHYRPSFAGRGEVMAVADGALQHAFEMVGKTIFVAGESGLGKTRFLLEAARLAASRDIAVVSGECLPPVARSDGDERSHQPPLQALLKPLRWLGDRCRECGAGETDRLFGARLSLLAAYEPSLREVPGANRYPDAVELPPAAARLRLFSALDEVLATAASTGVLLVTLDDLQWADELTLGWLGHAVESSVMAETALILLCAYRTEEATETLIRLARRGEVVLVDLGRLTESDVLRMVCDMLAMADPPAAFMRYVWRHAEGNPFFVAEYLRMAVTEGVLARGKDGRWQLAVDDYERLPEPDTVHDLVCKRLAPLDATAARLSEIAAVAGRVNPVAVLASAAGLPEATFFEGLGVLVTRDVLEPVEPGEVRFVHDKIREAILARLPGRGLPELHGLVAVAIESAFPERVAELGGQLGHHWERAGHPEKARHHYLAGARTATARYAFEDAEALYRAYLDLALAVPPGAPLVRIEYADRVLRWTGRLREALEQLRAAATEATAAGDIAALGAALSGRSLVLSRLGQQDAAWRAGCKALTLLRRIGDPGLEVRTLGNLAGARFAQGRIRQAGNIQRHALERARAIDNRQLVASVLSNLVAIHWYQGESARALEIAAEALTIHREFEDKKAEAHLLGSMAMMNNMMHRPAEALAVGERALAIRRQIGDLPGQATALVQLAEIQRSLGDLPAARNLLEGARRMRAAIGDGSGEAAVIGSLAMMLAERGTVDEARRLFDQAMQVHRSTGARQLETMLLPHQCALERRIGAPLDTFAAALREAAGWNFAHGDLLAAVLCLCELGHVQLAAGRTAGVVLDAAKSAAAHHSDAARQAAINASIAALEAAQMTFAAGGLLVHGELPGARDNR